MPLLQVRALTTEFRIGFETFKVVDNLSFDLEEGKTLAIVGESGCGKSMTALSIMRILPSPPALPSTGEVLFRGTNLLSLDESHMRKMRGGSLAMIFQDPSGSLNPVYTIGYQLIETAELHLGIFGEEAREKAALSLVEVGIASPYEVLDDYPHQLSGGMKQRVMIAMALMCKPDILIADEPTTALDVTIQAQVLDLLRSLGKSRGMTILLITHDMGVVAEMADEVIVMYASQCVEKGSVLSVFDRMAHPYTAGLFASRPINTPRGHALHGIAGYVPSLEHYPRGCRFHPRCPYAMSKCREGLVPEFPIGDDPAHLAACWLHDGSEESERMNIQGLGHERTFA